MKRCASGVMATSTTAPAWCSALASPTALKAAMLPVTPSVTRFPVSTRTVASDSATALDVALVVQPQALERQHRIMHVNDARFGEHVIGQPAGGDHQRVVAQLFLNPRNQAFDQPDVAVHPARAQRGDGVAPDDF